MTGLSNVAPFVGREAELAQLLAAYSAAAGGQGSLVMVAGEPGIGKTALCGRVASEVSARGGMALTGHCYEEGSLSRPYLPFLDALRPYVLERDPAALAEELGPGAADVARILPELRSRLTLDSEPAAVTDPEEARYRLYEAVAALLHKAAANQPLLLVLEDLHDADRGSLDLLVHLVRHQAGSRLLLVGTYRDVEVDRVHPLSSTLAELRRSQDFVRIALRGLDAGEVRGMMAMGAQQGILAPLAELVYRQTEGNPLFVQETWRYLIEEGLVERREGSLRRRGDQSLAGRIPEGLRDVIGKRMSRLSERANRVLALASVIGREFRLDVLQQVATLADEELEAALEEGMGASIIEESAVAGGVASYRFAHALFRQTLYEETIAPRRIRLHQQVARALEEVYSRSASGREEHAAELAEHFAYASDAAKLAKAVAYGETAALRSTAVFAYGEAVRHLERALSVQELLGAEDAERRCELLLELGEALLPAGEPARAVESIAPEALALAERLGDRGRASRACQLALEATWRRGGVLAMATAANERWLQAAHRYAAPGSLDRIRTDIALARKEFVNNRLHAYVESCSRLLNEARQLGDDETLFRAATQAINQRVPELQQERFRLTGELFGQPQGRASVATYAGFLWVLQWTFLAQGDRPRAETTLERAKELAGRTKDPISIFSSLVRESVFGILDGRLEQMILETEEARSRAEELGMAEFGRGQSFLVSLRTLCYLGRAEEALAVQPKGMRDALGEGRAHMYAGDSALALAHLGRWAEVRGVAANLLAADDADHNLSYVPLTNLLEAAVTGEDRELAARILPRLVPVAGLISEITPTVIARHLGSASALLGEQEQALRYYEQALEVAGKVRFRPELALTHLQMAELLAEEGTNWQTGGSLSLAGRPGPPQEAEGGGEGEAQASAHAPSTALDHLKLAIPELRDMKMQPALERALRVEQRLRGGRPATSRRHPDGLSDREVEVLGLIAAGRSNNEVAAELVLSVHTVERHLANIYRKIGARGRADAAAYAVHHHLSTAGGE